jgi:putative zinc finger/helix-turn-helix YgiT family protein
MICPTCEKAELRRKAHIHSQKIGRYTVKDGSMLAETCPSCGEVLISLQELTGYELRAAALVLLESKEIGGAEIKAIRKSMGLTQAELGELIGRDVATLSRQENDAQPMTRADQLALLALIHSIQAFGGDAEAFIEHERSRTSKRTLEIRAAS